jgi:hypothetical protein
MPDWTKVNTDADEGGRHRALVLAEELYEAGQWDGQSAIYFPDPYVAHRLVACGRTAALEDKVLRAAQRYEQKYGHTPTLCLVHPAALGDSGRPRKAGRVEIRPCRSVLPHHFWLGLADAPAQAGDGGNGKPQPGRSLVSRAAAVQAKAEPLTPPRARQPVMELEEARDGDE